MATQKRILFAMVQPRVALVVAMAAVLLGRCDGFHVGAHAGIKTSRRAEICRLRMQVDDMWKRAGRLARDKLGDAKGWVDSGADVRSGTNLRGAAGGALVGALVAGPFGALIGGWLGKGTGLSDAAQAEELKRLGLTKESAMLLKQLIIDLRDTEDSLRIIVDARDSKESQVRSLKASIDTSMARARQQLEQGNEDQARVHLAEKLRDQEKLQALQGDLLDLEAREQQVKINKDALEDRINNFEGLRKRLLSSSSGQDAFSGGTLDGTIRDPLLDKFDKWEKSD
ncbi:hypothetical protein GUITHDRAFT_99924 [Guillardia theta CCMP2712]|uniref:Uncharacterized protein n=1 Tax=Guillardia theta (strain CCMP2712) TaxID=905079 RepID=L1K1W4_GUITC|nr:hypothetical protein GUITHDRAFT_99924 [Guillardia theta CCMP2712]EKX54445.1 hypothetical protein GUITHDRAFT_99924 [Guillardia theta CCMP2712]|eukprot:XP_005841425.1 hypothetical protein GUITHDRAFT_99924 [Guillardia theta CCMP2712]